MDKEEITYEILFGLSKEENPVATMQMNLEELA